MKTAGEDRRVFPAVSWAPSVPPCHWGIVRALVLVFFSLGLQVSSVRALAPVRSIAINSRIIHPEIAASGDFIYWINATEGKLQRAALDGTAVDGHSVTLPKGAQDFCLSPTGRTAYVAVAPKGYSHYRFKDQEGSVVIVDLATMTVTGTISLPVDVFSIVCDREENLYVSHGSGQHGNLYKLNAHTRSIAWKSQWSCYERLQLHLSGDGHQLYFTGEGGMFSVPVSDQLPRQFKSRNSRGAFNGGAFQFLPDGKYAVNRTGNVFQVEGSGEGDMPAVASLEENLAVAVDPPAGRLWLLAAADGGLVTYDYPGFKIIKTEYPAAPGDSLVFDARHQKLWVARSTDKSETGGFDLYPIDSAPSGSNYPVQIHSGADEMTVLIHRDPFAKAMVGVSALMFLATVFWRRRPWPLPALVLAVGWLAWVQTVFLFLAAWLTRQPDFMTTVIAMRFLVIVAAIIGGLAWGILRGSRICYVMYALLHIAYLSSQFAHAGVLTGLVVLWLLFVIFCGWKQWAHLT